MSKRGIACEGFLPLPNVKPHFAQGYSMFEGFVTDKANMSSTSMLEP